MIQQPAMAQPDPFSAKQSAPELLEREANPGAHFGLEVVGANHRVHQIVTTSEDEKGSPRQVTNQVAVLDNGWNYLEGNQWNLTRTKFELQTGYASASEGRHKVNIGGNPNLEGSVALRMPDNQSFGATVHGLAYYDSASGKAILLSAIQDSRVYLTSPNLVGKFNLQNFVFYKISKPFLIQTPTISIRPNRLRREILMLGLFNDH